MPYMDHMGHLCSEIGRDNVACLTVTSRNFRAELLRQKKTNEQRLSCALLVALV